jgi:hypothetical protein
MTATPSHEFICNQDPEGIGMGRQRPDISAALLPAFTPCRSRGREKLLLKVRRIHVISTNLIPGMRN